MLDAQKADIRADIYSLGCTLYYLLAGKPPFEGPSVYALLAAHYSTQAPLLNQIRPEVPAELAAVVNRMIAKKPSDRYQTPGEVARALAPFFRAGANPGASGIQRSIPASSVAAPLSKVAAGQARAGFDPYYQRAGIPLGGSAGRLLRTAGALIP